ncbi:MAG: hypothetical protein L6V93_18255 [Clostridiales bacterium]|nr:MAG: hypothetical protein L6V93_18255 [Clostridiales bacterium]
MTKTYDDIISGDVLINATPVGMYPDIDACPIEKNQLSRRCSTLSTIPKKTLLLRVRPRAKKGGKRALYAGFARYLRAEHLAKNTV